MVRYINPFWIVALLVIANEYGFVPFIIAMMVHLSKIWDDGFKNQLNN